MIVEHEFITTAEAGEALARGAGLLEHLGFQRAPGAATEAPRCPGCGSSPTDDAAGTGTCPRCGQALVVARTFRRGKVVPERAVYALEQQPQSVAVEWDRGKMTIAAGIQPAGKPTPLHGELLTTLAKIIEAHVAAGVPLDRIDAQWQDLHSRIRRDNRRRRLPRDILLGLLGALVLAVVVIGLAARR